MKLDMVTIQKVKLFSDNCGVIKLAENPVHNRSEHTTQSKDTSCDTERRRF